MNLKPLIFGDLPCLMMAWVPSAWLSQFYLQSSRLRVEKLTSPLCFCLAKPSRVFYDFSRVLTRRGGKIESRLSHSHLNSLTLSSKSSPNFYAIPENNFNLFSLERLVIKCHHINFSHYYIILWSESSRHVLLICRTRFCEFKNRRTTTVNVFEKCV